MNKSTKITIIIFFSVLLFGGIVTSPRTAAAAEITATGSIVNSATIVKEDRNASENTFNNLATTYITGTKTANYVDSTDSFIAGNISGDAFLQSMQGYTINCLCPKHHSKPTSPSPAQPTDNSVPTSSSSSTTSSTSTGFSFLSSGPGTILVASENSFFVSGSYWFFIALIGNILMMLLGGYLRLRSGRSPGFAFTY